MFLELIAGGYLVEEYVRHKYFADAPPKPKPASAIELPRVDDGAPIPRIYGRCRVRQPWLAYAGTPLAFDAAALGGESELLNGAPFIYGMNLFFVLGIPIAGGSNHLHHVFVDDLKLTGGDLGAMTGNGGFVGTTIVADSGTPGSGAMEGNGYVGALMEFLNGNPSQKLVDPTTPFTARTVAGARMAADLGSGGLVPGYRGYLSVFHYNGTAWFIGNGPRPGIYTYEASSYPGSGTKLATSDRIGDDANPADVVFDLLTGSFGKLGLSPADVDLPSFQAAAATLASEGYGYSRSLEDDRDAGEDISEILEQVGGMLFHRASTDKIVLKLIRDDFDPLTIPTISPANCVELQNFAAGGRDNLPTKLRVVFTDRSKDYQENSSAAHFLAQASGQDGVVREVVLQRPGITMAAQAEAQAARELSARCRPTARCRAICDRNLVRVEPGDVVFLTWPEYPISEMVMRVAAVSRGTLDSDHVALDLIQDQSRVRRGIVVAGTRVSSFPTSAGLP